MNADNIEHKEFIGFYRNLYPKGYCKHVINEFDKLQAQSVGANRKDSENAHKHVKDDYQIFNFKNHLVTPFKWLENGEEFTKDVTDMFFAGLQACYNEYSTKYSILTEDNIRASMMKLQKTMPGGGYHVFHPERGSDQKDRVIVYMLYLNTLQNEEGGETEFLYQKLRIKPEENLMLFWPAAYTHTHRGNTVLGNNDKYIITGWFYYD